MSDPAIEAAQRAWTNEGWDGPLMLSEGQLSVSAAREALASVRKLHRPVTIYALDPTTGTWVYNADSERVVLGRACMECSDPYWIDELDNGDGVDPDDCRARNWPCPTAKLIYATEEL